MNFVSYAQLARDVSDWVKDLPRYDAVIGIERSGMIPAAMLALHWNVPLFTLSQAINGNLMPCGGNRLDKSRPIKSALVIDDSSNGGAAMRRAKIAMSEKKPFPALSYAAAYVSAAGAKAVDHYCRIVKQPRAFAWNLFHHEEIMSMSCLDMDGVLCEDYPSGHPEGPEYHSFLHNARPLNIPTVPVGAIVSCRLEKYRPETEAWLAAHRVMYKKLHLMHCKTPEERREYGHARYKAEIYDRDCYGLFVENEIAQAMSISAATLKPVLHLPEWRLL